MLRRVVLAAAASGALLLSAAGVAVANYSPSGPAEQLAARVVHDTGAEGLYVERQANSHSGPLSTVVTYVNLRKGVAAQYVAGHLITLDLGRREVQGGSSLSAGKRCWREFLATPRSIARYGPESLLPLSDGPGSGYSYELVGNQLLWRAAGAAPGRVGTHGSVSFNRRDAITSEVLYEPGDPKPISTATVSYPRALPAFVPARLPTKHLCSKVNGP
jgi:hypothetical protein